MEKKETVGKNKGGRPRKAVKKSEKLGFKCSLVEHTVIQAKAKSGGISVSEYLRSMALTGKIDHSKKALPNEVLETAGRLNHLAANINQIAKKRNSYEQLTDLEMTSLKSQAGEIKLLVLLMKSYLQ